MFAEWRAGVPYPPIDMDKYTVDSSMVGWIEKAVELVRESGFVVVLRALNLQQVSEVQHTCGLVSADMLKWDRHGWGNRGPRRYSFGQASLSGQLAHHWSFTKHLLDNAVVRQFVAEVFQDDACAIGCGGEFVLGNTNGFQRLHSDCGGQRAFENRWPPPYLIANFYLEDQLPSHAPTRIIPDHVRVYPSEPHGWEESASHRSLLAPIPRGAVVLRDARTLHSGSPNREDRIRFLPSAEYMHRAFCGKPGFPPLRPCIPEVFLEYLSDQLIAWTRGLALAVNDECGIHPDFALGEPSNEEKHHWCYDCRKWRRCRFAKFVCCQIGRSCLDPCDWCHYFPSDGWCSHE